MFVSNLTGEARHFDYTCNPSYAAFIADDLVAWAKERCDEVTKEGHLICGLSLSGLASAYLGLTRPRLFSSALCQSGSFWWSKEWLRHNIPTLPSQPAHFWISVGDQERESGLSHPPTDMRQEVSQVDATERFVAELKAIGCPVIYNLFQGGHRIEPWKKELPGALKWLIKASG